MNTKRKSPLGQSGRDNGARDFIKSRTEDSGIIPSTAPNSQNLATPRQVEYLNGLRRAIGLKRWNALKTFLQVETPGTHNLSRRDASTIIDIIKVAMGGRTR